MYVNGTVEPEGAKENYSGLCLKLTYLTVYKEPGLNEKKKIQSFSNT